MKFLGRDNTEQYAYSTSWGVSTRLIGGIIMVHGDDKGLKLPPRIAPVQVIIIPVALHKEGVIDAAQKIRDVLGAHYRVDLDTKEGNSPVGSLNQFEMKAFRSGLNGPQEIENNRPFSVRRDTGRKDCCGTWTILCGTTGELLDDIRKIYMKARCVTGPERNERCAYDGRI
jgi:prolyl-tRNA synthetase